VQSNEHAPAKFRVDGPVSNLTEFASAFQCSPPQPMARTEQQRVVIW
jgi:putative endopeptidase